MFTPNENPSPITGADVITDEKSALDFSFLPKIESPAKSDYKSDTHNAELEATKSALIKVAIQHSNVELVNSIFSPESSKEKFHQQAIDLCLKNNLSGLKQAEAAIEQAETKLLTLNPEYEQIKQIVSTIQTLLENPSAKIMSHQQQINQNLAEIKELEPILESAFTRIHFTVTAAKAIDPSLIKQVFDPKQQSLEYIVLNKENFVNNAELFVKASKIVAAGAPEINQLNQLNQLNHNLNEKLSAYTKIKAEYDECKQIYTEAQSKENIFFGFLQSKTSSWWSTDPVKAKLDLLNDKLLKSIDDYHQAKDQIKPLEDKVKQMKHAEEYLKYHDNWSTKPTQKEIDTAKLIETKKQENVETNKIIDNLIDAPSKIAPHLENLTQTEHEINEQQKILLDNQILSKTHREAADYFQAEAQKLVLPMPEADIHADTPVFAPIELQSPLADISHGEPQL